MRAPLLLALLVLTGAYGGCVSDNDPGLRDAADAAVRDEEEGVAHPLADGTVYYSHVVKSSTGAVVRREGGDFPTFHLPYHANLSVEIAWRSVHPAAAEIVASIGQAETRDRVAHARGPSPLRLDVSAATPGDYVILIDPPGDPGVIVEQTFSWRATAQEVAAPPAATNETVLGHFTRGLAYFAFTPTGPDHQIWCDLSATDAAVMIHPSGFMMLSGPRGDTITVQGSAVSPLRVDTQRADAGGRFGLKMKEDDWNRTHWLVFASANASGPSPFRVTLTGADVKLESPPVEADARLYTEDDWTGALDARAGRGDMGGGAVVERSLSFTTRNGTLLAYSLGGFGGFHADSVTLRNSTTTRTWTGFSSNDFGLDADASEERHLEASFLNAIAPADSWQISIRTSVRALNAWPDYVLVADVLLPPALHG